jgi:hypothetical protein
MLKLGLFTIIRSSGGIVNIIVNVYAFFSNSGIDREQILVFLRARVRESSGEALVY